MCVCLVEGLGLLPRSHYYVSALVLSFSMCRGDDRYRGAAIAITNYMALYKVFPKRDTACRSRIVRDAFARE